MKKTALVVLAGLAFGLATTVATAHPTDTKNNGKKNLAKAKLHLEQPQQDDFFDDFESYKDGSDIVGQGGWEVWYTGGTHATVSSEQAVGSLSMRNIELSDIVQRFTAEDGVWTFSVDTYVPSAPLKVADGFVILMNQYGGPDNWSVQVRFDPAFKTVESQFDANTTSLLADQWVTLRCEIDLDADTLNIYYNDVLFAADLIWSENVSGGGITSIACTDLFSNGIEPMFYDNVSLKRAGGPGCYPDCDGDTELSFFDFLCYTNAFNAGDMYADCDGDKELTFFDFLCYTNAFNAGC